MVRVFVVFGFVIFMFGNCRCIIWLICFLFVWLMLMMVFLIVFGKYLLIFKLVCVGIKRVIFCVWLSLSVVIVFLFINVCLILVRLGLYVWKILVSCWCKFNNCLVSFVFLFDLYILFVMWDNWELFVLIMFYFMLCNFGLMLIMCIVCFFFCCYRGSIKGEYRLSMFLVCLIFLMYYD